MKFKLLLLLLLTIPCLLLTAPTVHAQADQNNTYNNTNPDVPHNLHTYTQSIFIEIASTLSCQLSGVDPTNPTAKCLGIDPKTKRIGYVEGGGGAIDLTGNFIASTFFIPVSTHDYVSNLASNFGFAKKTYAQEGVGFNGLRPTLQLWQAFRNITYMFFVILFVVMGLGIMFRVKIDPRTVMTIQNQIPKIIVGLVLVTFSYAIAGFLIDLMYVLLYLIISVFAQQGFNPVDISANNPWGAIGGLGGISGIANGTALSISGIVRSMFDGTIGNIVGGMIGALIGGLIGDKIGGGLPIVSGVSALIGGGLGLLGSSKIISTVAWVIAYLVITIAIFSALLRLWFVLIKAYIYLLISVVFAPFYITYGILPGTSGFGSWIKSMISNLSVFPVTVIMILLGKAFVDGFSKGDAGNPPFVPPMVAGFTPDRLGPIIGLAIILMLPEVANMIRDTLKSPAFKYDASIGKSLGTGVRGLSAPVSSTFGKLMDRDRQTGKAKGWLAKNFLGRNPFTRTLFNTDDYTSARQKAQSAARAMMKGAAARRTGGTPPSLRGTPINGRPNSGLTGGSTPPQTNPTGSGPSTTPTPQTTGTPPPTNIQRDAEELSSQAVDDREKQVNQVRNDLRNQGYNENSINNVVRQQFGEEELTNSVVELQRIADEQRRALSETQGDNERARIQNRLDRIDEKIRRLS